MASPWYSAFSRRSSALVLAVLFPLGLAVAAPVAAAPGTSSDSPGFGSGAQPANFLEVFSMPNTATQAASPASAAATTHVGIVPSALRPIDEYRTAPVSAPVPVIEAGSANPAALQGSLSQLAPGPLGIPGSMVHAYKHAEDLMATVQPSCQLPWHLLAGVGKVESGHANGGHVDANGNTTTRILGPVLDGHLAGNAVITDTDQGALDGNDRYDRAVGPMQFMPGTWTTFGADGNNDGVTDPNNIYDAAFAAGRLLCSAGGNLSDVGQTSAAILRYNYSAAYVQNVQAWALAYSTGAYPTETDLPPIGAEDKSIDAEPDLKPAPTPDSLPPPEDTGAPTQDEPELLGLGQIELEQIEIAPGVAIPVPKLPCFIDCPAPPPEPDAPNPTP